MSATSWHDSDVTEGFDDYNDILEQTLGYPFVFQLLDYTRADCEKILDYGTGPGKVAYNLAEQSGKKIIAVDESEGMLETAIAKRSHPLIAYKKVVNDQLDFISDQSLDGAMLCFVLLNLGNESQILKIIKEVCRVLKPGARCVILDTNPDSIGIEFSTFISGVPKLKYSYGQEREAKLFLPSGKVLDLVGYNWPDEMYFSALRKNGFKKIQKIAPTLRDVSTKKLAEYQKVLGNSLVFAEWSFAPYAIYVGEK
jgi:ubiquinone/menaquinone biosynthesis C-methylase UbiE